MYRVVTVIGLLSLATALAAWAVIGARQTPQYLDTAGQEEPLADAVYENGWNVANHENARIQDTYLSYRRFLGEPITGFDGQCQSFRLGRLCYAPGNPPDWRIELANLGADELEVEGYTAKPGATLHPAVRDYRLSQLELGVDLGRVFGRVISDPICDKRTRTCKQFTDKALFLFDEQAVSGDQVQRAPLGLWRTYPRTRPTGNTESIMPVQPLPLIAAGVGVVVALWLLLASQSRRGLFSKTSAV